MAAGDNTVANDAANNEYGTAAIAGLDSDVQMGMGGLTQSISNALAQAYANRLNGLAG